MARGGRRTKKNQIANTDSLSIKLARALNNPINKLDINGELLKQRVPIHFGGMSDPFSSDTVSKRSIELLKILADFNHPTVISTKNSKFLLSDNVLTLLKRNNNFVIQVSLPCFDPNFSSIIEPNIRSPLERIKDLNTLSLEGIHTIVRLQPLFPPMIDDAIFELIPRISEAGVKHVIVEFLKLPLEKSLFFISNIFNSIDWNGFNYYKDNGAIKTGREWVLPPQLKWELLQPIINSIRNHGMTYGAGDYGLNHLGDTDCCCGIDNIPGFNNWFHPNIAYIIRNSPGELLTFNDVNQFDYPQKSIRMYMNSNSRPKNTKGIKDYIKNKWNDPGKENAPDTFLGVSFSGELDTYGNCIYKKSQINNLLNS